MSRAASPFTGRRYGVVRVTREWEMARSSFYFRREIAAQPGRVLGRRGPKTAWSDAALPAVESRDTLLGKSSAPTSNKTPAAVDALRHVIPGMTLGQQQNQPRPPGIFGPIRPASGSPC